MTALDGDIRQMPLGMDTPITTDGKGVSGGQRQRILIARALVRKRIVIAHRLSTIQHCNRIIVLKEGRVATEGTYEELKARGYFPNENDKEHEKMY